MIVRPFIQNLRGNLVLMILYVFIPLLFNTWSINPLFYSYTLQFALSSYITNKLSNNIKSLFIQQETERYSTIEEHQGV